MQTKTPQDRRLQFARDLWAARAVSVGDDGQLELDLRSMDHPKQPGHLPPSIIGFGARYILGALAEARPWYSYDAVAGAPLAGNDWAKAVAELSGKACIPLPQYEFEKKRCVALPTGYIDPNTKRALLVNDSYVSGDSTRDSIQVLADVGIDVVAVGVLVSSRNLDYVEFYGRTWPFHFVFTFDELAGILVSDGKIDRGSFDVESVRRPLLAASR